ncbi:MAG: GIY-YIG nuclease family protein [Brumimicrobium sp.]|nr:GIY-YIG nuclease family protein [Brumimicrobium sp.]
MNQEFLVYVLYSPDHDKIYIGMTASIIQRFRSHNQLAHKGFTVKFRPWVVVHTEFFDNKASALKREKSLKGGQGRREIREIFRH